MPLTADRAKPAVPFGGSTASSTSRSRNLINSRSAPDRRADRSTSRHSLDRHISQTWRMSPHAGRLRGVRARAAAPGQALVQRLGRRHPAEPQPASRREARHRRRGRRRPRVPHGLPARWWTPHRRVGRAGSRSPAIRQPISPWPTSSASSSVEKDDLTRIAAFLEKPARRQSGLADAPDRGARIDGQLRLRRRDADRGRAVATAAAPDSNHDMGGDIVPVLRRRGAGRRVRLAAQRGAGLDRPRPLLLARRRHRSSRSSTRTRT